MKAGVRRPVTVSERQAQMRFAFSDEQNELRHTVRRFLQGRSPESEVRRLMATETGYDPLVWKQMADQLGLQSVTIPEAYGGSGLSFIELTIILEEMGGALLCAPYFSTVALAATALLCADDESAKAEYLPGIASGATIATLAFTEEGGSWDLASVSLEARQSANGWTLTGRKMFVVDAMVANLLLVVGRDPGGLSLFAVRPDAAGLVRTPLETIDQTRKQARLEFVDTPARLISPPGGALPRLSKTLDLAAAALAAEQVGGAQRCLDAAVEYAKNRVQFGRAIGSFQAIKHKCADMLVEVESARSAAYYAAWAAEDDPAELPVVASLAKSYCSEAFSNAAAQNIQIHGGMGFTWEHPAHLYYRRARSSEQMLGDPVYHRELIIQRTGL
jgi:alkylation response protein AidB-like acyl-CoA dehydrogenase